jgi:type IV pilus assembly protein PilY1
MSTKYLSLILGAISLTAISLPVPADDTEIFMTQFSGTGASGGRPKVLIIFDSSGSMSSGVPENKPDYDPDINWLHSDDYPGAPEWIRGDVIYWDNDDKPLNKDSERSQYIPTSSNQCHTSIDPLYSTGRYNDFLQVWRSGYGVIGTTEETVCECQWSRYGSSWQRSMWQEGETDCLSHEGYNNNNYRWQCWEEEDQQMGYINKWQSVEDNDETRQTDYLECAADIDANDPTNPNTDDGWASDDDGPFRDSSVGSPWTKWSDRHDGDLDRTLYTGNYLAWYYNDDLIENRTKIQIARDVVTELVASNPQVDFGLMVFNSNNGNRSNDENGGRVIRHLNSMTESSRDSFVSLVNSLTANGWTPLCETFYEAYRYIAKPDGEAQSVWYGDDDRYRTPFRDACAERENANGTCTRDGTYNSPMGDCENIYLVLMTDGKPTNDLAANSLVRALPEVDSCGDYETDSGQGISENCMPRLAKYMFEEDLDDNWENGNQRVVTYTIGFLTDQELLSDTAEFGGGTYFTAYNAHELADAFQATLTEILSSNTSFAAPAVAVDAYNRTRSLNAEYIAMFRPDDNPRWNGNLKKLEMETISGSTTEEVVDALGVRAIDPVSGNIKDTATTFWTTLGVDGMEVDQGGAGERLILRNPSTRVLWTNTGNNGALEDFATANANLTAELFGTTDANLRAKYIEWSRGVDLRDEDADNDRSDIRPWIMGDIMHSTPEAVNFGNPQDSSSPDVRIIFGTNAGFLHMIESDTGNESWAFFPKEIAPIVPTLYKNDQADDHPYGVDGSPTVLLQDQNGDGNIVNGDGDHAYLFFGLRRGSQSEDGTGGGYYALDISNPDTPTVLWQIDGDDLPELGQSWSKPNATFVPGHDNPVIIVGAGYDTAKDSLSPGAADTVGRGIYILDATNGGVVWSATPWADADSEPETNLNEQGLQHCVTAEVTTLDTNGDHVTDRIYFPDTGGNVWRVDLTDDSPNNWSIFKLASLGGNTEATDRRLMDRIDVAITRSSNLAYDALMVGSGNRAHPLERLVDNRFYMIRDFATQSVLHVPNDDDPDTNACENEALNPDLLPCVEIPAPITEDNLYDATANLVQDGTDDQKAVAKAELASPETKGWYITLEATGEKNLSRSITLQGRVFFTTFVPPDPLDASIEYICRPSEGTGFLYAVGLHDATAKYDWAAPFDATLTKADRSKAIKDHIPDFPVAYFGEAEIGLVGVGAGTDGSGIERTGMGLSTSAVYWMQETD